MFHFLGWCKIESLTQRFLFRVAGGLKVVEISEKGDVVDNTGLCGNKSTAVSEFSVITISLFTYCIYKYVIDKNKNGPWNRIN